MGQAVADLPDPLEGHKPADGISADDLLSKLAGDEIDRLLAESDNGEALVETAPLEAPIADSFAAEVSKSDPPYAEPAGAPQTPDASAVDLDAVLSTAEAERSALLENQVTPETNAAQIDLGESAERRRGIPFFLKPLVWMSAPLDPWPDQIREVLGKIGLMTLINALAVIAYVLLVRKPHH